jgi:hypothetical protein
MLPRRKAPRLRVVKTSEADPTGDARPEVRILAGQRSEAIDRAEEYLIERDLDLFQRGDFIVRVASQDLDIVARRSIGTVVNSNWRPARHGAGDR